MSRSTTDPVDCGSRGFVTETCSCLTPWFTPYRILAWCSAGQKELSVPERKNTIPDRRCFMKFWKKVIKMLRSFIIGEFNREYKLRSDTIKNITKSYRTFWIYSQNGVNLPISQRWRGLFA
ncbi:uncharacterized protein LOC144469595 [Augochlora pura]